MNRKPITPKMHGIIDYAFAAILVLAPPVLKLNKKARRLYKLLGAGVIVYSALTDYPAGVIPVIPYQDHQKIDDAIIGAFAVETLNKGITKDKRACAFHIGITTLAVITVMLTNWDADPHQK